MSLAFENQFSLSKNFNSIYWTIFLRKIINFVFLSAKCFHQPNVKNSDLRYVKRKILQLNSFNDDGVKLLFC